MNQLKKIYINMKRIIVDCQENDWEDIKYGGPSYLGFDFIVSSDIDNEEYIKFIKEKLKEYGHRCLKITIKEISEPKIWSKKDIEECIKKNKF